MAASVLWRAAGSTLARSRVVFASNARVLGSWTSTATPSPAIGTNHSHAGASSGAVDFHNSRRRRRTPATSRTPALSIALSRQCRVTIRWSVERSCPPLPARTCSPTQTHAFCGASSSSRAVHVRGQKANQLTTCRLYRPLEPAVRSACSRESPERRRMRATVRACALGLPMRLSGREPAASRLNGRRLLASHRTISRQTRRA